LSAYVLYMRAIFLRCRACRYCRNHPL
jgi:hypothetical protein